jgi:hypothetical protein
LFDIKILEIDLDENSTADEELGVRLVDSVVSMNSDLWEDIVARARSSLN